MGRRRLRIRRDPSGSPPGELGSAVISTTVGNGVEQPHQHEAFRGRVGVAVIAGIDDRNCGDASVGAVGDLF